MTKVICAHDLRWAKRFADERERLSALFDNAAPAIHHIGSTAIPGIWAKPVIDILVEAINLSAVDARAAQMTLAGYEARGEYGIKLRRYFRKPGVHVHVFAHGSPHIARHLAFRDFLLSKPEIAAAYSDLKRSIADKAGVLPGDYAARKAPFVAETEKAALAFFAFRTKE